MRNLIVINLVQIANAIPVRRVTDDFERVCSFQSVCVRNFSKAWRVRYLPVNAAVLVKLTHSSRHARAKTIRQR